jgi:hypothetical protein
MRVRFHHSALLPLLLFLVAVTVHHAGAEDSIVQDVTEAQTEASLANASTNTGATASLLQGASGSTSNTTDLKEDGDSYKVRNKLDVGLNSYKSGSVSIRPMQGFQQIADSDVVKKMLKEQITKKVPVMYQTMMMVENGAATGFIGAMNNVGNLLDSTMQASNLQLAMYDAFDDMDIQKRNYQKALLVEMEKNHQNSWPSALWAAAADSLEQSDVTPMPTEYKSDHKASGGPKPTTLNSPDAESAETTLVDTVFKEDPPKEGESSEGSYKNQEIRQWKEDFREMIGDIKFRKEDKDGFEVDDWEFDNPVEDGRKAIDKRSQERAKEAYKGMLQILRETCNFKNKDENYKKPIFEKAKPSDLLSQTRGGWFNSGFTYLGGDNLSEARKNASAPDMPLTVNFIDALYSVAVGQADLSGASWSSGGECGQIFNENKEMPDESPDAAKESGLGLEACKNGTCLAHRIIAEAARFIGRSRVYHEYVLLIRTTFRLVPFNDPNRKFVNALIEENLNYINLESAMADNRERWINFTNKLSAIAQARVGSTVFRPQSGNVTSTGVDNATR